EAEAEGLRVRAINAIVPLPAAPVASVRLVRAGDTVAQRAFATTRQPLAAPTIDQTPDAITVRWGASPPALVRYVPDNNAPVTLGVDVGEGELRVDPRTLPGGAGHFEIVFADQADGAARARSSTVTLPNSTPRAWVTGPTQIRAGETLFLFGHGANQEDGALADLRWVVDSKDAATGATLQVERLAAGAHTIVLTVRDAKGKTVQTTYTVTVMP
ncbi:MAG: hypothetical protein KGJ80_18935, partial [Chloroflexota bacterium]|nr:hypothetical protein [Chloroflexota bacterium]